MNISRVLYALVLILGCTSCSVYKAASNEGVDVDDIEECTLRSSLLSKGMQCIESKVIEGKAFEIYRAQARKSGLNYGRAVGHGVLDVCTLGLWEVVGTPTEGAMDNNRGYIVAKVIRPSLESERIEQIAVFDADGKLAFQKKYK